MTIRPMLAIPALMLTFAVSAADQKAADAPNTPKTIRIVAAEAIEEGEPGDRQWTFTLISAESGACYAIDLLVFGVNPQVYDPPAAPPFSDAHAFEAMRSVLGSFAFEPSTAQRAASDSTAAR